MDTAHRIRAFRRLHDSGCFVLPNPWDRGSAIALASLGYRALATSSAAASFAAGLPDAPTSFGLEATLANVRDIVEATELPVNADFQHGYGDAPESVAENTRRCVDTGVAGLSIEDTTGDPERPLYDADLALDRVKAARAAIDATGRDVVLTARCEAFLVGSPNPLTTVLERLVAFADGGADCLYAPGLRTPEDIATVVSAVAPKPVNVLAADPSWMTHQSLADLGVRRISVGSALARVAWKHLLASARHIAASGSFESLTEAEPFDSLNALFLD